MNVGGFSESIWHFAGYLRLIEPVARAPDQFDGDPLPAPVEDRLGRFAESVLPAQFDEMASQRVPFVEAPVIAPGLPLLKLTSPVFTPPSVTPATFPSLARRDSPLQEPDVALEGSIQFRFVTLARSISVDYQPGGTETLLQVRQINQLDDRDVIVSDALPGVLPPEADTSAAVAEMLQQAQEATPGSLPFEAVSSTEALIAAITARNEAWAQTGQSPHADPDYAPPSGLIVDGVVVAAAPEGPTIEQIAPWREAAPAPSQFVTQSVTEAASTLGVGVVAETGLNQQVNQALIVDLNEAVGSMIVGGDAFFSRGIVQVNILTDSDHVDIAIEGAATVGVASSDNQLHNIAEFVTHDMTARYSGAAATPFWHVDTLAGNFYDVKTLVQFNGLDDSDRTVQASEGAYFEARTGWNDQANFARVTNLDQYDIIIIAGDYHRADWIFQYNIMLDSDVAKLYAAGGSAEDDVAVTTGFNNLTNSASITTYDSAAFAAMNSAQHDLLEGLRQGVTILTPNADWGLSGSISGELRVLYVSGDYYDVNVITQINLMVDVDQSIQASAIGGELGVAAGGNSATNYAEIIDPGTLSASRYLGGQAYDDAILVQTNLVTDDDTVTIHDTTTLVPEFVAFAEQTEMPAEDAPPLCKPIDVGHQDILI